MLSRRVIGSWLLVLVGAWAVEAGHPRGGGAIGFGGSHYHGGVGASHYHGCGASRYYGGGWGSVRGAYGFGGWSLSFSNYGVYRRSSYYPGSSWFLANSCYSPSYSCFPSCVPVTYGYGGYDRLRFGGGVSGYGVCSYPADPLFGAFERSPNAAYLDVGWYSNPWALNGPDFAPLVPAVEPVAAARVPLSSPPRVVELAGVSSAKRRLTSARSVQNAESLIAAGVRLFRGQKYHGALQKFRSATRAAPELAEAHFLHGHALTAMNRLDDAADAFKHAVRLGGDPERRGFHLDDIYSDARVSKSAHVESVAQAALDNPSDPNLLIVLGMFLHYDGQPERAARFFARANSLVGPAAPHLLPNRRVPKEV